VNKSFGYTGKGVATYPNGDIYDGYFVNGVSKLCPLYIFKYRSVRETKVHINTLLSLLERTVQHPKTSTLVHGKTIKSMALEK